MNAEENKIIGIIHFRIGLTDGVSLEIDKRKQILQQLGYQVITIGGELSSTADYIIQQFETDSPLAWYYREKFFQTRYPQKIKLKQNLTQLSQAVDYLYQQFQAIFQKHRFTAVFIHNVFSLAVHPAATMALEKIVRQHPETCFILVNHDFYWERQYSRLPRSLQASKFCENYLPITGNNVVNVVINKAAQSELRRFKNIPSTIIGDKFDFDAPIFNHTSQQQLLSLRHKLGIKDHDIVFLQATRVVKRKAIELGIDFVSQVQQDKDQIFANYVNVMGVPYQPDSRVHILLSNVIEQPDKPYFEKLQQYAQQQSVSFISASQYFTGEKFWQSYDLSDFVLYPSLKEGFGNQFLELVAAKKIGIIFEYPVYSTDIKPKRYRQVMLGKHYRINGQGLAQLDPKDLNKAVKQFAKLLKDPAARQALIEKNLSIARKHHSLDSLRQHLTKVINHCLATN